MRNLSYYVACSVDGFISGEDGSTSSFLGEGDHLSDLFSAYPETLPTHLRDLLGIRGENRVFDTVLMGRTTYEVGLKEGITNPYSNLTQYLFSRSLASSPDPNVELVTEDALEVVKRLKQTEGKDIWLCGGGKLASALFPEIDTLILKVNPFVMGAGIPLFAKRVPQTALRLVSSRTYPNGFALMHYRTKPRQSAPGGHL